MLKNVQKSKVGRWLKSHPRTKKALVYGMAPLLIYFVILCAITWPWITHFNNFFLTDMGDGLQNVWNVWWIEKSVHDLGQLPWHTGLLHYPFGVTLITQTLNPFNGFVALGMLQVIDLNHAYNIMVIFSFIVGGLTTFWLCYYFSKKYFASLIGGGIFTFSSYHLAHGTGHMQLTSLEWLPLFILLWWMFVKKPSYKLAAGSAVSLLLVLLCDYYYFLYALMTAGGIVLYFWLSKQLPNLRDKEIWFKLGLFLALCLVLVAPLPIALLITNSNMKFTGIHDPRVFSTDILTPILNGGNWMFFKLTDFYWKYLPSNIFESTVYLGLSVWVLLVVSVVKRRGLPKDIIFWQIMVLVFGILSLGPRLMIRGNSIERIPMPYAIFEKVVPGMKLSGMPVRMMVMVTLGAAVIAAMVLARLKLGTTKGKMLLAVFALIFIVEILPRPMPASTEVYPNYVKKLKQLPATGSVLDEAAKSDPLQLFNQTYHEKPLAGGYVTRRPKELDDKQFAIFAYNIEKKYDRLCREFKIRYITVPIDKPKDTNFPIIYQDNKAIIYDIKNSPEC